MKTTLYFATVVAVLFSLGFATQSTYGQAVGTRVAVIDVPYILKNYPPFKAEVEKIQKDIADFRRWVTEEQKTIRLEKERLGTFNVGSPEYKQTEERIAEMQLRMRLEGAKREKQFMEDEAKAYLNSYKRMESVVADFAFRNQIGLVLRFSREDIDPANNKSIMVGVNRLVVFQNRLDISEIILDAMPRDVADNTVPVGPHIPR